MLPPVLLWQQHSPASTQGLKASRLVGRQLVGSSEVACQRIQGCIDKALHCADASAWLHSRQRASRLTAELYADSLNGVGLDASRLLASAPGALASAPNAAAAAVNVSADGSLWENGEWWMLLAAQSMALGTIMVQWVTKKTDPVVAVG